MRESDDMLKAQVQVGVFVIAAVALIVLAVWGLFWLFG